MMIFWAILKIIVIVLCVILGIIAVILFVPICYELDTDIDQKEFKARVHWLGRLVRFEFRWKEKAYSVLKILWFVIDFTDPEAVAARKVKKEEKARKKQLKQQKKEAKEREKQARQSKKEKQQESADREARAQQREEFRRQQGEAVENGSKAEDSEFSKTAEDTAESADKVVKNISEKVSAEQEVSFSDKIATLGEQTLEQTEQQADQQKNDPTASNQQNAKQENIRSGNVNVEEKQSVLDKLKSAHRKANSIKDKVKSGIDVIQFLRKQELIPAIWVKLKVFLSHIRPRVLRGHLKFGLSNPADTGQVLGGIAMVPFLYQTELQIEPDFEAEDNYLQGQVYSRGHMCCIHLIILIIRMLKDKKIRSVIHTIRENK